MRLHIWDLQVSGRDINPLVRSPHSQNRSERPAGLWAADHYLCFCVRVQHVHTHSIQQMDKKLSLCILIGHLRLLSGLLLGQNRSHLITHHDNIITDVQTNKEDSWRTELNACNWSFSLCWLLLTSTLLLYRLQSGPQSIWQRSPQATRLFRVLGLLEVGTTVATSSWWYWWRLNPDPDSLATSNST